MTKFDYFNGFVEALLKRYKEEGGNENVSGGDNDLSKLKVLKLLFLSVAENETKLDIFDNFVGWDLGPVELDIYESINIRDNTLFFEIDNKCTKKKSGLKIPKEAINEGEEMVSVLKNKNPDLIKKSASLLVDITHEWRCWRIANMLGKLHLSKKLILDSNKFYG